MSELDFSATDDESLHLQIDETMETETDESLETGKRDAFRSMTSDSDSESILTKNAVKEYFANGEEIELKWDYKKRFYDEVNSEFTDYIKRSVKGVAPDVTNEVLDTAVKRYFTSKKEAANRKSRNKETLHKQRQATYERKKEKVRRRIQAAEKKNWTTEKKNMVLGVLKSKDSHKLMSSDEEADEGFISHPYSWESDAWRNIKQSLDKKYQETCSSRSRRLLQKRQIGSVREQEKPKLKEEFSWMFN